MSRFDAVLFDCDGVLVDSEPITNGVLRDMLEERGWALSAAECQRLFIGRAVKDQSALIEAKTGQALSEDWMQAFRLRRNNELIRRLSAIDGAHVAVAAAHQHCAARIACASGADRFKVELQLQHVGLMPYFEGRIFSGHETPRSKPAPDVYLQAAAHLQCAPARCLVIEDTPTGVTAGVAAGATVWAYCPPDAGLGAHATRQQQVQALREAGAQQVLTQMADLPSWLAQA
jgi:HAD superfamily hydrolase (TIGR01509 family)